MPPQTQPSLKSTTIALMIAVALFYDGFVALVNFIPILGQILSSCINVVAFCHFWLWFKLHKISFSKPKRGGIMGLGFIIELIPIVNALPAWTLAITLIALDTTKKEEGKVVGSIGPRQTAQTADKNQDLRDAA